MKKLAIALLLLSASALAATHYWTLVDESKASSGKTICTYECSGIGHGGTHMTAKSQWYRGCSYSP